MTAGCAWLCFTTRPKADRQYELAIPHVVCMNRLCCACTIERRSRLTSVSDVVGTERCMHYRKRYPSSAIARGVRDFAYRK